MSSTFFDGWKIWEKLVFILACLIVITILIGCVKLAYTHWRLRKYAAVEREKKEQTGVHQMSQRRNECRRAGSDTVPFGIRALESGIEVEGVWISPGNSVDLSRENGSPLLSTWDNESRRDRTPRGEKRQQPQTRQPTRSTSKAMEPSRDSNKPRPPETNIAKPTRTRHPPLSSTKYQGNPYILRRQSSATSTLQGLEAIHRASTSIRPESGGSAESTLSSNYSSHSGADVAAISASAPDLLTGNSTAKLITSSSSTDFELLDSHRISQAAETGQLTPRGRGTGKGYTWDLSTVSARTSTSLERPGNVEIHPQPEEPPHQSPSPAKPMPTPILNSLPPALLNTTMPNVLPFTHFCKMAPPGPPSSPSLSSTRSNSTESMHTLGLPSKTEARANADEDIEDVDSAPSSPIIPASEGAEALRLPPPPSPAPPLKIEIKRGSFEKYIPQIIRGHGSGFEILKPGSLNPPLPREGEVGGGGAKGRYPPVSLNNHASSNLRSTGSEGQKKGMKRQRFSLVLSSTREKGGRRSQGGSV